MHQELQSFRVIDSKKKSVFDSVKEVFKYRELLFQLAYRNIRVKYAQTVIGLLWSFINPIFTVIVLTFVFGTLLRTNTHRIPPAVYTMIGMIGWTYFANVLGKAGSSLVANQNLVKKIYFPRLIIPLSKAISSLVNFIIVLLCSIVVMYIYEVPPSINIVFFPIVIVFIMMAGLGFGIWISALTIKYRDLQHTVPILLRLGMFITPIAYSSVEVPKNYLWLYYSNPMAGVVDLVRWSILDTPIGYKKEYIFLSLAIVVIVFITSLFFFNKIEKDIADII